MFVLFTATLNVYLKHLQKVLTYYFNVVPKTVRILTTISERMYFEEWLVVDDKNLRLNYGKIIILIKGSHSVKVSIVTVVPLNNVRKNIRFNFLLFSYWEAFVLYFLYILLSSK